MEEDEDKVKGNARDTEARIELIAQSNNRRPYGYETRGRLLDVVFLQEPTRCRRFPIRVARRVRFYRSFKVPLIN